MEESGCPPRLDGLIEIVRGSFSNKEEETYEMGEELGIPESRLYSNYQEMVEESKLPKEKRTNFVTIVTLYFFRRWRKRDVICLEGHRIRTEQRQMDKSLCKI